MRQHRINVIFLGILVLMLLTLVAFYVWMFGFRKPATESANNSETQKNEVVNIANTTNVTNNATNNTVTNTANTTNTTNSTPSSGTSSTSGNITVTTPSANATLAKTFTVSGFAKVFENVVQVRVKDNKGVILLETFVNTNAPDVGKTGTFSKSLTLEKTTTEKKGKIEFFTSNEATGAEEDKVTVNINF